MHEEYAKSFRIAYAASLASFAFSAIALVLIFYNARGQPAGNQSMAVPALVLIAGSISAATVAFCKDMLNGMRRRGMIK